MRLVGGVAWRGNMRNVAEANANANANANEGKEPRH